MTIRHSDLICIAWMCMCEYHDDMSDSEDNLLNAFGTTAFRTIVNRDHTTEERDDEGWENSKPTPYDEWENFKPAPSPEEYLLTLPLTPLESIVKSAVARAKQCVRIVKFALSTPRILIMNS